MSLAERTSHSFAFSPLSVSHIMKSLSCARDNRLGVYLLSDLFSTTAFVTNPVCGLSVCTVSAVASQPETIVLYRTRTEVGRGDGKGVGVGGVRAILSICISNDQSTALSYRDERSKSER